MLIFYNPYMHEDIPFESESSTRFSRLEKIAKLAGGFAIATGMPVFSFYAAYQHEMSAQAAGIMATIGLVGGVAIMTDNLSERQG